MQIIDLDNLDNEQTREYNRIFVDNLKKYTEFTDKESERFQGNYRWWLTYFATRDTLLSTVPADVAKLLLAKQIYSLKKDIVIRTKSRALAAALRSFVPKENIDNKLSDDEKSIKTIIVKYRDFFGRVKRIYSWKKDVDRYLVKRQYPENITLLCTDIFSWNYSDGKCTLRDFENFDKFADVEDVYLYPIYFANSRDEQSVLIRNICNENHYNMILREEFLSKKDYIELLFLPMIMKKFCRYRREFEGIDITEIIAEEIMKSSYSQVCMIGLLEYKAASNMKKKGISLRRAISWYEAQPSSLGLFAGVRKYFPLCSTMGYASYPFDGTLYGIAPSKEQMKQKVAPEEIGVMSEAFLDYPRSLCPEVKTKVVPAFRMQKLFHLDRKFNEGNSLLVVLSYWTNISKTIISFLEESADYYKERGINILLKNHPACLNNTLSDYGIDNPKNNYTFVGGTMDEATKQAKVVVFSQSGSGFETIMMGKPVIAIVPPGMIAQNFLPEKMENDRYFVACTPEDVTSALDEIWNKNFEPLAFVEHYIAMADETLVRAMLDK